MKLFIFDEASHRGVLEAALAEMGAQVRGADDLDLAVQHLYDEPADLLILGMSSSFQGLALLERARTTGSTTPALVVMGDAKRALLGQAAKLGVKHVVMKPVDPEQLRAAVAKAMAPATVPPASVPAQPSPVVPPTVRPVAAAPAARTAAPSRAHRDILMVVMDHDAIHQLQPLLPEGMTIECVTSPKAVRQVCQGLEFRLVLIDASFSSLNRGDTLAELRPLLPGATFLAIYPRSKADRRDEALNAGLAGHLLWPCDAAAINELLFRWFDWKAVLHHAGAVFRAAAFPAGSPRIKEYYALLAAEIAQVLHAAGDACESAIVLDLTDLPQLAVYTPELVVAAHARALRLGIDLRLIAPPDMVALLKGSNVIDVHFVSPG